VNQSGAPLVSVIIATYNWPEALQLAIESVRLQNLQDYEILVIGDACTDDSAEVVKSFGDPRIRWHNLSTNHGSQWGPNNYGLSVAKGEYIAYLGHDDIWYPTHLERCMAVSQAEHAEVVCSLLVLYGPPGSKIRSLTGLFVGGEYSPNQFMPPTSIIHRRGLTDRIGLWRNPSEIDVPIDHEFLLRAFESGAKFASTDELTAFKFNAAWRRGAYRHRRVDEQAELLDRIAAGGDFRASEMLETLRSAIEGRFVPIVPPRQGQGLVHGGLLSQARRFKSSPGAAGPGKCPPVVRPQTFFVPHPFGPFEWHGEEQNPDHGPFRWTGPHVISAFELPATFDRPLIGRLTVLQAIAPELLDQMKLSLEGRTVATTRFDRSNGLVQFEFDVPWQDGDEPWVSPLLEIKVPFVKRPCDLNINSDARWLGIAVGSVDIWPADGPRPSERPHRSIRAGALGFISKLFS
jgi:hypothetical protein